MTDTALLFARYFEPAFRGGGPIQTLTALLRSLPASIEAAVICSNEDLGDRTPVVDTPDEWVQRDFSRARYCTPGLKPFLRALRSSRDLDPDIVYVNSFFDVMYSLVPQLAARIGFWRRAAVVLAPRGELYAGAIRLKSGRKRAFIGVYKALGLHRRVIWHASTSDEAESIKAVFGERVRIETKENETSLPVSASPRPEREAGPLRLVFASRAAAKKGLLTLLEGVEAASVEVDLEVIGAFEDPEYQAACEAVISRLTESVGVTLRGALPREELISRLERADLMALPTRGENFGHVIAEALSVGCPVMCSAETPWTSRLALGGGVVVDPNTASAWATAIAELAAETPADWERRAEGAAQCYEAWRGEDKGAHIFERALERRAT